MNATEQRAENTIKEFDEIQTRVGKLLQRLISPYDLSEQNLRLNMTNNPYFNDAVNQISYYIYQHRDYDRQREIQSQFKLAELHHMLGRY